MNVSRLLVFACLATAGFAQQQGTTIQQQQVVVGNGPAKPDPKISPEDRERATKMLDLSESQARSFEAPMRSYTLYQVAQSYVPLEKAKSRALYRDAFTATLDIRDDDDLKQRLQDNILTSMLEVSQPDVEELMSQAEPQARKRASIGIAQKYLAAKKFERAVNVVEQMTSWAEFPYDIGSRIMMALPDTMAGDFRTLFTMAFTSFQNHDHSKGITLGGGDFGAVIARFGGKLPARMTLDAVDEVLKQAKAHDDASITVGGDSGTASFTSLYEFELFQLLPVIRKFDEGHAKKLLEDDNALRASSQQFPNGVDSLNPPPDPNKALANGPSPIGSNLGFDVSTGKSASAGASSQDLMRQEAERLGQQIARDSENDPQQAIAQTAGLPVFLGRRSPRADALLGIAQGNSKKNPQAAKQALDEMRKAIQDLQPRDQVHFLAAASKLYIDMDEQDKAESTLKEGFKLSDKLLTDDTNADDPNKALKAYWPSVDAYRQFLEIETKISQKDALKMLDEIQDPEMQTVERVMFTNALLGRPMRLSVTAQKTKNGNSMSIHSSD